MGSGTVKRPSCAHARAHCLMLAAKGDPFIAPGKHGYGALGAALALPLEHHTATIGTSGWNSHWIKRFDHLIDQRARAPSPFPFRPWGCHLIKLRIVNLIHIRWQGCSFDCAQAHMHARARVRARVDMIAVHRTPPRLVLVLRLATSTASYVG